MKALGNKLSRRLLTIHLLALSFLFLRPAFALEIISIIPPASVTDDLRTFNGVKLVDVNNEIDNLPSGASAGEYRPGPNNYFAEYVFDPNVWYEECCLFDGVGYRPTYDSNLSFLTYTISHSIHMPAWNSPTYRANCASANNAWDNWYASTLACCVETILHGRGPYRWRA